MKILFCFLGFISLLASLYCQEYEDVLLDAEVFSRWDPQQQSWVFTRKSEYQYDSAGNRIDHVSFEWIWEQDTWKPGNRSTYAYDSRGNRVLEDKYLWDSEKGLWDRNLRVCGMVGICWTSPSMREYSYNETNLLTEEVIYIWDESRSMLAPLTRYKWDYNAQELLTDQTGFEWDSVDGAWVNNERWQMSYDPAGNLIEESLFSWGIEKDDWIPMVNEVRTIDSSLREKAKIKSEWRKSTLQWIPQFKETERFDTAWNMVRSFQSFWEEEFQIWKLHSYEEFAYDSLGKQEVYTSYRLLGGTSPVPDSRAVYHYDSLFRITKEARYYWDPSIWDWKDHGYSEYSYDMQGDLLQTLSYRWEDEKNEWVPDGGWMEEKEKDAWGHIIQTSSFLRDPLKEDWIGTSRHRQYWSCDLIGEQQFSLPENAPEGSVIGPIATGSMYAAGEVVLSLLPGKGDGMFSVHPSGDGNVLHTSRTLDFESQRIHHIALKADIDRDGLLTSDTARVSVYLRNVNDNAPVVRDTAYSVEENLGHSALLGPVVVTDPDGDLDSLDVWITSGDEGSIFELDQNRILMLDRFDALDYETKDSYQLTLQVSDGKFSGEGLITVSVIDTEDPSTGIFSGNSGLLLYPNPVGDVLRVDHASGSCEIRITGADGICIFSGEIAGGSQEIDLSFLPAGLYFLSLNDGQGIISRKIIKR